MKNVRAWKSCSLVLFLIGLNAVAQAQGFSVVYKFNPLKLDSANPSYPGIIAQGRDGNLYSSTTQGGNKWPATGTVYKITPSGTFTTLYTFDVLLGTGLVAPLVQGTDGLFYGISSGGGNSAGYGTVFKISSTGHLTVLYNFKNGTDGAFPVGGLTQGLDGNFYGTTERGGGTTCSRGGCGTVFKITPSGALTTLYQFGGGEDGRYPDGGLVQASDGKNVYFYGTTAGDPFVPACGTIFHIGSAGASTFSRLYTFPVDGTTGCNPEVTLLQRTTGVLYGDTTKGGLGSGVFYSLDLNLPPFVSILPPLSVAKVGKTIQILGQDFLGTSGVSFFNGASANFTVVSDTYLTAVVPNGAQTGFVTVTTPVGTLTSNKKFRVTPQVKSFIPISGSVGSSVTITGVSLLQTTKVTIGGKKASFTVLNDSTVTATVPDRAATGKKITITTQGGTASSPTVFTVI